MAYSDPTMPRFIRVRPGLIRAVCGEEMLNIERIEGRLWRITRGGYPLHGAPTFHSLNPAKTFAAEWLGEFA